MSVLVESPSRLVTYLDADSNNRAFQWVFTGEDAPYIHVVSPPEDPDWDYWKKYGSLLFSNNFVNTVTIWSDSRGFIEKYNVFGSNSEGNTVEFSLRFDLATNLTRVKVSIYDETSYETITLTESGISLDNIGSSYSVDLVSQVKTIRIILFNGEVEVYVDNVLVLEGDLGTSTTENKLRIEFQNSSLGNKTYWQSLKYAKGVNYPTVDLSLVSYELQFDSSPHFDSVNLLTYDLKHTDYSNDLTVVYVVSSLPRQWLESAVFYWRVRVYNTNYISEYTNGLAYIVPLSYKPSIFSNVFDGLPDENAYSKQGKSSNVAIILKAYSTEIDLAKYTNTEAKNLFTWYYLKDGDLAGVLGTLLNFSKADDQTDASYRHQLQNLLEAYRRTTVKASLFKVIVMYTGVFPDLIEYLKTTFFRLSSNAEPAFRYRRFFIKDQTDSSITPTIRIWSKDVLKYIVDITISNPYSIDYDGSSLNVLIRKVKPAFLKTYIS